MVPLFFMKSVARSFVAGLALAALARLGVAVVKAWREGVSARQRFLAFLVRGYSPSEGSPPVAALRYLAPPVGRRCVARAATTFGIPTARSNRRVVLASFPARPWRPRVRPVAQPAFQGCCGARGATTTNGRSRMRDAATGGEPSEGLYPPARERNKPWAAALAFAPCLPDHHAEAGERSERKPRVERPRFGLHKTNHPTPMTAACLSSHPPASCMRRRAPLTLLAHETTTGGGEIVHGQVQQQKRRRG